MVTICIFIGAIVTVLDFWPHSHHPSHPTIAVYSSALKRLQPVAHFCTVNVIAQPSYGLHRFPIFNFKDNRHRYLSYKMHFMRKYLVAMLD